jgi:integrase
MGLFREKPKEPSPAPTPRGAARKWCPESPASPSDLKELDELLRSTKTQATTTYELFKQHCLATAAGFSDALRGAVATMRRDGLESSTIKEYIQQIVKQGFAEGLVTGADKAVAASLASVFERLAAHREGRVAALVSDDDLMTAIEAVEHEDVRDVLMTMRATGLRCSDVARIMTHHVTIGDKGLEVRITDSKNRKSRRKRFTLSCPAARTWHWPEVSAVIRRLKGRRPKHTVKEADQMLSARRGTVDIPDELLLIPYEGRQGRTVKKRGARSRATCPMTARVDETLRAVTREGGPKLTTYSFRLPYLDDAIEVSRDANGCIDLDKAKRLTAHLDEDTLQGFYLRLKDAS